jgi:hypothetical protein
MSGETEKEKLFLELLDGFEWKYDIEEYPNRLFGFKDNICLFEIYNSNGLNQNKIITNYRLELELDLTNSELRFNEDKICKVFELKFNIDFNEFIYLFRDIAKKYFKCNEKQPYIGKTSFYDISEKYFNKIEKKFLKLKDIINK